MNRLKLHKIKPILMWYSLFSSSSLSALVDWHNFFPHKRILFADRTYVTAELMERLSFVVCFCPSRMYCG